MHMAGSSLKFVRVAQCLEPFAGGDGQLAAVSESIYAITTVLECDGGYTLRDTEIGQFPVVIERPSSDTFDACGEVDAGQFFAITESPLSNFGKAVRQLYGLQVVNSIKSLRSNRGEAGAARQVYAG